MVNTLYIKGLISSASIRKNSIIMALPLVSSEVNLERVIEELEGTYARVEDFLGLRMLGNFYWLIAEEHRSSDISRMAVIEWFEKASDTYKAALNAYQSQSTVQIPDFDVYLQRRINEVDGLVQILKPYGQRPVAAKVAEPAAVGVN